MSFDAQSDAAARERLSALVDGELDAQAAAQACGDWRERSDARASWHAYHMIGDALRSEDLAADPSGDLVFLQALRVRLQDEPVVLAPQPLTQPASVPVRHAGALAGNGAGTAGARRWSWMGSSAVAAGFVAVAGVVMFTRGPATTSDGAAVASLAQGSAVVQPASLQMNPVAAASEPQAFVANGALIRDARLDRYLAAHKQFAGSSALGVPSGFLRNATAYPSER